MFRCFRHSNDDGSGGVGVPRSMLKTPPGWPAARAVRTPAAWREWFPGAGKGTVVEPRIAPPDPVRAARNGPRGGEPPETLSPPEAIVPDVPFVGFADAARIQYPDKEVVNPSLVAAAAMLAGNGDSGYRPGALPPPIPRRKMAITLDDIKQAVAFGSPVFVLLPPAPGCHFVLPSLAILLSGVRPSLLRSLDDRDCSSGMLGRMADAVGFDAIRRTFGLENVSEIVHDVTTASAAVVVGYSDPKKVFLVHDPSYGPAEEIAYDTFDAGWRLCGKSFGVRTNALGNGNGKLRPVLAWPGYRARSADEKAARSYRDTYAAAATGDRDMAWERVRDALGQGRLSPGYRHLLHVEASSILRRQDRIGEAITEVDNALVLHRDNPVAWALATRLREERGAPGDTTLADAARTEMVRCWNDHEGLRALGKFLPTEFWIPLLSTDRGWAGERG